MRITHILPTRSLEFGGPIPVAEAYVKCFQEFGHSINIQPFANKSLIRNLLSIWRYVKASDIIHIHCLWNLYGSWAAFIARTNNIPYIITPHGMLDRWALSKSSTKKKIFWHLIERKNIFKSAFIHFLNNEERSEAFERLPKLENFVIPNGIFLEHFEKSSAKEKTNSNQVFVLFLGRLHPKKGLDLLIPAFANAALACPTLHLLLAGPGHSNYISRLSKTIEILGIESKVSLLGMISGQKKFEILSKADFFVLPSYQEGDSIAVKEAMAAGLPVLITPACHFNEVEKVAAGLVIEPDINQWSQALTEMYSDGATRLAMGCQAQNLIRTKYTWKDLASKMQAFYFEAIARKGD